MDRHIAVLGVHAHGNFFAVLFQHPGREVKIRHCHAAEDAPAHAQREVFFNALFGADAAAYFDIQAALLCQRGDGVVIGKGPVLCAVQIDDVEVFCPGFEKSPRLGAGVFAVDGHPVVIALRQAHDFAAPQVNGWE